MIQILMLAFFLSSTTAKLADTFQSCSDVSCIPRPDEIFPVNSDLDFEWMSAGLPHIFWKSVKTRLLFNTTTLSPLCKHQLEVTADALHHNKGWAYEFIDASGKTPAGLLKATVTAIGDYDQCLGIVNKNIQGMYCMIDMHHLKKQSAPDELALDEVNLFKGHPFLSSLCLPSACQVGEIQTAVKSLLKPYMIKVAGHIHCDTSTSISWYSRLVKLTSKQIISVAFIAAILVAVGVSTCIDLFYRIAQSNQQRSEGLVSSLSVITSSQKLIFSKRWPSYEVFAFEAMKFAIIFTGTISHIMSCVENSLSYATMDNHRFIHWMFKSPSTQFLMNDAGIIGVALLTGIATFTLLYPVAKSGKLPYDKVLINRIIRFLPPMVLLLACEFVWPIFGSGPLYTRVAEFGLKKCSENWFYNLLFVNNFLLRPVDICAGHSFWTSVDMQLFLIGLIGVFIFAKNAKAGIWFCIAMIAFGTVKVADTAIRYNVPFSMYVVDPSLQQMDDFIHHIHMQIPSYMPAYFAGFLISYARMNGYLHLKVDTLFDHAKYLILSGALNFLVNVNAMMRNSFAVYPDHLNWLFISLNRILQLLGSSTIFLYVMALKPVDTIESVNVPAAGNNNGEVDKKTTFDPIRTLLKLTFPLYICNYLYIRMEYFTRRSLSPSGVFWIIKKLTSSFIFVFAFTIVFHLLLMSPLDQMKEHIMKKSRDKNKTE